jgi:alpha/beta superfamily hydrolase
MLKRRLCEKSIGRHEMKKSVLILLIVCAGLFGSVISPLSQTSVREAHYATDQSGRFIIYYGGKESGSEDYSLSISEGRITLTDQAQFKMMEMGFTVNMDLVLDTLLVPQNLNMNGKVYGETYQVSIEFSGGMAISRTIKDGDTSTTELSVHDEALILPNGIFYPYTFLVKRYDFEKAGKQEFFGYVAPQMELPVTVEDQGKEEVDFEAGSFQLGKFLVNLGGVLGVNLWVNEKKELVKLSIPLQGIEVYEQGYKPAPNKAEIDTLVKKYSYEDITFRSGQLKLAGMVTVLENGENRHPACIIISGSGPQDRNGKVPDIGFSVQYETIAHELSNSGILVLRYDERGVGESEGDFKTASLTDLVGDVKAGIKYLRSRPDVDSTRICLVGHSEGAIIAPMIAAEDKNIKAIVLMAGTAKPLDQVMIEQQGYLLSEVNLPDEMKEEAIREQREFFDWVRGLKQWTEEEMPQQYKDLRGKRKWFLEHFNHDPLQTIARVKCKVLILQGKKDRQVFDLHALMLSNALDEAGHEDHLIRIFPDLDHLFCKTMGEGDYGEYAKTERPIDTEFLHFLSDWLKKEL